MKRLVLLAMAFVVLVSPAYAISPNLVFVKDVVDGEFNDFVAQAGTMTAYRSMAPAEPLGVTGFDISIGTSVVEVDEEYWTNVIDFIDNATWWNLDQVLKAKDASDEKIRPVLRVQVRKGLPYGFDIGATYARVEDTDTDITMWGGEIQYAVMKDTETTPALAVRSGYSQMNGIDDIKVKVYTADFVLSERFSRFTPYAGVGYMRAEGSYDGDNEDLDFLLEDQVYTHPRFFAGVQCAFFELAKLTIEAEGNKEMPVYSAKLSFGW